MPQTKQYEANRRTALLAATTLYQGLGGRAFEGVMTTADHFLEWLEEDNRTEEKS